MKLPFVSTLTDINLKMYTNGHKKNQMISDMITAKNRQRTNIPTTTLINNHLNIFFIPIQNQLQLPLYNTIK